MPLQSSSLKVLQFAAISTLLLFFGLPAFGQTQSKTAPDCSITLQPRSTTGTSAVFDNRPQSSQTGIPCTQWILIASGTTSNVSFSVQMETAQDNGVANCAGCSFSIFGSALTAEGTTTRSGYGDFVRVNLTAISGGTISATMNGWRDNADSIAGGGGGVCPGGSITEIQVNGGVNCAGYADFEWKETATTTGMTGLQIGLPEPDLSAGDGPANILSVVKNSGGQINFVNAANNNIPFTEITFYSSRGTVASPANLQDGDFMGGFDSLGYSGGAFLSADSSLYWVFHTGYLEEQHVAPHSMSLEKTLLDAAGGTGFVNAGPTTLELNNGTPVSSGGSLAQLDLSTAMVGNASPSTPAIFNSSQQLASGSYSGNKTEIATVNGSVTNGHLAIWDVSGNLEDGGAPSTGGSVFTGSTATNPSFSATPTFSLADVSVKSPVRVEPGVLSANVTAVTFTNKTAGAKFSIAWLQAATGGPFTVAYGGSANNTCAISPTASVTTVQYFEVGADGSTVNGTGCESNESGIMRPPEVAAPSVGPAVWADSTDHDQEYKNGSGDIFKMFLTGVGCNPVLGTCTWSGLTAPTANLSLSMGSDTSTFNTTTALSQMFAWKNTTAATSGTSQGSPVLAVCGRAWIGSDTEDCLTLSELPGNGSNAAIAFTVGHTGSSTGTVTSAFPGPMTLGASTPACTGGTAGGWCANEGTGITSASAVGTAYFLSTTHELTLRKNGGGDSMAVATRPSPIHATAQTGSIATATLCSTSAGNCDQAGQYHIHWDFIETGVACAGVAAGSVTIQLTWTDTNATAHTVTPLMMGEAAAAGTPAMSQSFFFQTSLANAWSSGDLNVSTNGTIIQYATTYTACTTGTGTYQLDIAVTRLQ